MNMTLFTFDVYVYIFSVHFHFYAIKLLCKSHALVMISRHVSESGHDPM